MEKMSRCAACLKLSVLQSIDGKALCPTCAQGWQAYRDGKQTQRMEKPKVEKVEPKSLPELLATATQKDWELALQLLTQQIDAKEQELMELRQRRQAVERLASGVVEPKKTHGLTPDVRQRLQELNAQGVKPEEIADRLGLNVRQVVNSLAMTGNRAKNRG